MSYIAQGIVTWVSGAGNTSSAIGCVEYRASWSKTCLVHLISGKTFRKNSAKVTVAENFSWASPSV